MMILGVGFVAVLTSVVKLVPSRYFFGKPDASRAEAMHHAKLVHLALIDFDNDYGSFPDATTIAAVTAETRTSLPLGTSSSNEIFRQLLAHGLKSEKIFWAKSTISPRKPDDVYHGSEALKKGECSFAYVAGLSTSGDPSAPLLMAPVNPSGRGIERRKDYGERAVILFVDGSVKLLPIDKHGHATLNGINLFDPRQPFWKGKAPDVKWPE